MNFLGEKAIANKIYKLKKGDCPYTLFLGAGASDSSGIQLSNDLVFEWKRKLFDDLIKIDENYSTIDFRIWTDEIEENKSVDYSNFNKWKAKNNFRNEVSEYSLLFSTLYQTTKERQLFIEELIDNKKPAFGYLFLAGLISEQRFNRILTTNFDDLLSDALFKYYDIKPISCAFDSMVSGIRVDSQRPKIIKLHGDFLYDNLRNIRSELRSLDSNMEEKMFEMCKDRGLIVVGYSGSDKSIINPLNEMLRKTGYLEMGVHWCFIKEDVQNIKAIDDGIQKDENVINKYRDLIELHRQYSDKVFFYEIDDFDSLMETMFVDCKCSPPQILNSPNEVNPFKEFNQAVLEQGGKRIVDLTGLQLQYYNTFYEAQINKSTSEEDIKTFAEHCFSVGKQHRDKGLKSNKKKEKIKCFETSLENYKKTIEPLDSFISKYKELPTEKKAKGLYLFSLKRLSGLYIAIAKVDFELNKNISEFKENLMKSIVYVNQGIEICNNLGSLDKELFNVDIVSFPYNGCCAYSLLNNNSKSISDEDKGNIYNFLELDIELRPDRSHARTIFNEDDFSFVKNKLGKEISEKFLIK